MMFKPSNITHPAPCKMGEMCVYVFWADSHTLKLVPDCKLDFLHCKETNNLPFKPFEQVFEVIIVHLDQFI